MAVNAGDHFANGASFDQGRVNRTISQLSCSDQREKVAVPSGAVLAGRT